jgi:hypothetical protein
MLIWLIVVAVLAVLWAAMWNGLPKMALGVLIGLPIGWLFSRSIQTYLTGNMEEIPLWLPPLPLAIVAVLLLVVGLVIFLRADDDRADAAADDDTQH